MQAIQESQKMINEISKASAKMEDERDRLYYKMEMAKVRANHGLAFALLAVAKAIEGHDNPT